MILVFGSINVDLVAEVAAIPRPGETVLAPGYTTLFGGKGANQAVAAARVSAPGRVAMVGRVGDDAFGRMCRDNLAANGVGVEGVAAGPEATGCAFITVDPRGENAITVASGANGALGAAALPAAPAAATLVLQMEVPLSASLAVARRVRDAGGRVIWNLAPVPVAFAPDDLRAVLAVTDVLVVNEHEARDAAARLGSSEPDGEAAAALLARPSAEKGGVTCVVTLGARGPSRCIRTARGCGRRPRRSARSIPRGRATPSWASSPRPSTMAATGPRHWREPAGARPSPASSPGRRRACPRPTGSLPASPIDHRGL